MCCTVHTQGGERGGGCFVGIILKTARGGGGDSVGGVGGWVGGRGGGW